MCIHGWMELVTTSISYLNGNVSNCGNKKFGSYNWLVDLHGKALISTGIPRADGQGIPGLDL